MTSKQKFLIILIIIFFSLFYLFNITYSEIWIDESFTKALIKHPFNKLFKILMEDFHPPLYFIGLKLFTYITGINNLTIRLFSVIGAVCTLVIAYTKGQKVFGRNGGIFFSFLLFTLPMIAIYTHDARMYTWAAFLVTGVFLYSILFIRSEKKSDLFFLGLFSIMAAYVHYYCLIAVFWANIFVFIHLLLKKKKTWTLHLIMMVSLVILYMPWIFVLLSQTSEAQKDYWIPRMTLQTLFSCYLNPFAERFRLASSSVPLIIIIYGLTFISIYNNLIRRSENDRLALGLSLVIFNATVFTAVIISVTVKPILFTRYIMTVVTMLMVPPVIFFINNNNKILKGILLGLLFCFGVYTSFKTSFISMGPYKQTLNYLQQNYPDIKKIVHVTEVTTGPLLDYNEDNYWSHYWLKNDIGISYTNLDVFDDLLQVDSLDEALNQGEKFCLVNFKDIGLNNEYRDMILSSSNQLQVDTIADNKVKKYPIAFLLYILEYKGDKISIDSSLEKR